MQEGSGQQEIPLGGVSAGAFRVVLRYLYTAAVPAWEELQGAGREVRGDGAVGGGQGGDGKGGGKGGSGGKGKGKEAASSEEGEGAGRAALELEVLKGADLFQAEGLLTHCRLEAFRGGLTVHTVVEQLVWAHKSGPAEARAVRPIFLLRMAALFGCAIFDTDLMARCQRALCEMLLISAPADLGVVGVGAEGGAGDFGAAKDAAG